MKHFLLILVSFVSVVCFAQDVVLKKDSLANKTTCVVKFGYLSYDAAIKAMPEYAEAQKSIETLKLEAFRLFALEDSCVEAGVCTCVAGRTILAYNNIECIVVTGSCD